MFIYRSSNELEMNTRIHNEHKNHRLTITTTTHTHKKTTTTTTITTTAASRQPRFIRVSILSFFSREFENNIFRGMWGLGLGVMSFKVFVSVCCGCGVCGGWAQPNWDRWGGLHPIRSLFFLLRRTGSISGCDRPSVGPLVRRSVGNVIALRPTLSDLCQIYLDKAVSIVGRKAKAVPTEGRTDRRRDTHSERIALSTLKGGKNRYFRRNECHHMIM